MEKTRSAGSFFYTGGKLMETFKFKNGDNIPVFGLGTWKSSPGDIYAAVLKAIELGYRHIDCAAIYGNEKEIGAALKDAMAAGDVKREDLFVTSKLWNNAHRKEDVAGALEKSLSDLCLDYLDLYLVHWPVALVPQCIFPSKASDFLSLEELPLSETWEGMEDCVKKGMVRHIGVSNFSIKKLEGLMETAKIRPEMNQIEMHPYLAQLDMLVYCRENKILVTAYAPLGSGDRPAAMKNKNESGLLDNPVVMEIAENLGHSPAQVLIQWAMERGTLVIPKSVTPQRLAENFLSDQVQLSGENIIALGDLDSGSRYVSGSFWAIPKSSYTLENLWD
jgi:alcohol dehydrogenase (NADP+)